MNRRAANLSQDSRLVNREEVVDIKRKVLMKTSSSIVGYE
jgi:hypothetical protein